MAYMALISRVKRNLKRSIISQHITAHNVHLHVIETNEISKGKRYIAHHCIPVAASDTVKDDSL